ncbi:MAG: hypothetical protein CML60_01630 [Rhodobacteraceae bacterium]|nr:hypothetical protein [Paracoccaceae bacterium]
MKEEIQALLNEGEGGCYNTGIDEEPQTYTEMLREARVNRQKRLRKQLTKDNWTETMINNYFQRKFGKVVG